MMRSKEANLGRITLDHASRQFQADKHSRTPLVWQGCTDTLGLLRQFEFVIYSLFTRDHECKMIARYS